MAVLRAVFSFPKWAVTGTAAPGMGMPPAPPLHLRPLGGDLGRPPTLRATLPAPHVPAHSGCLCGDKPGPGSTPGGPSKVSAEDPKANSEEMGLGSHGGRGPRGGTAFLGAAPTATSRGSSSQRLPRRPRGSQVQGGGPAAHTGLQPQPSPQGGPDPATCVSVQLPGACFVSDQSRFVASSFIPQERNHRRSAIVASHGFYLLILKRKKHRRAAPSLRTHWLFLYVPSWGAKLAVSGRSSVCAGGEEACLRCDCPGSPAVNTVLCGRGHQGAARCLPRSGGSHIPPAG